MESDKYLCAREEVNGQVNIVIVDTANPQALVRKPITADSAVMNPVNNILALKCMNISVSCVHSAAIYCLRSRKLASDL